MIYYLLLSFLFMNNRDLPNLPNYDFKKAWGDVDSLYQNGFPKEAFTKVNEIYLQAKQLKQNDQLVKAIIYQGSLSLQLEEFGVTQTDKLFREELKNISSPYKNILHSYYGEFLNNYLQNNRYIINQRTNTVDSVDLLTASSAQLIEMINQQYEWSLKNANLLTGKTESYKPLLNEYDEAGLKYHTTLYELLMSRAFQYYSFNYENRTDATSSTVNDIESLFGKPIDFVKLNVEGIKNSKRIKLYQDILKYELDNNNQHALAFFDLQRLVFVHSEFSNPNKDKYYEAALKRSISEYKKIDYSTEYSYHLASLIQNREVETRFIDAIKVCEEAIKLYPESSGSNKCQNIITSIKRKELTIQSEIAYPINGKIEYYISSRNIPNLNLKIVEGTGLENLINDYRKNEEEKKAEILKAKVVKEWNHTIKPNEFYHHDKNTFTIEGLKSGKYLLLLSNEKDFSGSFQITQFQVSNINYTTYINEKGRVVVVTDRVSGEKICDAKVEVYSQEYDYNSQQNKNNLIGTYKTDKEGKVIITTQNRNIKLIVSKDKDKLDGLNPHWYNRNSESKPYQQTEIYTDRAIYRPGQVVYYKTLALNYDTKRVPSINTKYSDNIVLRDANGQEVATQKFTTNEYGSANGSFTLPTGKLTGYFTLQTKYGNKSIQVEEYKRPTFEVKFDTIKETIALGENVTVKGEVNAFAGFGLPNAKIRYTVNQSQILPYSYYWYARYFNYQPIQITEGETITDSEGKFSINFTTLKETANNGVHPIYNYNVKVDAVDQTGETQMGEHTVSISEKSSFIETDLPKEFDKADKNKFIISVKNINSILQDVSGNFKLYKLKETVKVENEKFWDNDEFYKWRPQPKSKFEKYAIESVVLDAKFTSGKDIMLTKLKAGVYKLEVSGINNAEPLTQYIVVTDFVSKQFPNTQHVFHKINKSSFEPGDKAIMEFGTGKEKQNVYVIVSRNNDVLKEGWVKVDKYSAYEILLTEADRGGLSVKYFYTKNNRFYEGNISIFVPWSNKDLEVTYENFRDKLLPGENTEFRVKISGKNKEAIQAEVLAAMYDASLDKFAQQYWSSKFHPTNYSNIFLESVLFGLAYANELSYGWANDDLEASFDEIRYPALIDFPYGNFYQNRYEREMVMSAAPGGAPRPTKSRSKNDGSAPEGAMAEASDAMMGKASGVSNEAKSAETPISPIVEPVFTPRTNLNETVFFYPSIMTDKEGNFVLSFKMNEAITKWRLMTMAHTKDLKTGYYENFIQTKKDVLIVANAPRFVREGDEIFFTARVTNLSEEDITANANLDLANAITNQPFTSFEKQNIPVKLLKGESKSVAWKINVPYGDLGLLKYTVSVVSGKYTDGESSILPVLTNRILITESLPFSIRGNQTKTFDFLNFKNNNSTTLTNQSYVVEVSSHPVWYAIQAMPYIIENNHPCASELANRIYVNSLSNHIMGQHPEIEAVFKQWQTLDKDALLSNLQKNEALKNAILEETPWVMDALNESQQKQNIARLFDKNTVNSDLTNTITALKNLQMPDGSFSWLPGSRSDEYITTYIIEVFGRMKKANIKNDDGFINSSLTFVDNSVQNKYIKLQEWYKKQNLKLEDYMPSSYEVYQLFVRSYYNDFAVNDGSEPAYKFYYNQAIKNWNKYDLFTQALLGSYDIRIGGSTYKLIEKSIIEKSFKNEELGMYWNAGNGYRWYEMPIERHVALMEFLEEAKCNNEMLDELKIWLLKNKQGNNWKSTKATASAIHALLIQRGTGQTNTKSVKTVSVVAGNISLPDNNSIQAGTQYYKKTFVKNEINKSLSTLKVTNDNANIAWGSAYWQYFEDLDKVKVAENSPLNIKKSLYKEINSKEGKKLLPLTKDQTLEPGDVLVSRLTITSDRDLDYVFIKDHRGSGMEPYETISSYRWSGSIGYYESIRDLATHYYVGNLNKGTHVLESKQRVVHKGNYSGALASIQSFYAPEFGAHSSGERLVVK